MFIGSLNLDCILHLKCFFSDEQIILFISIQSLLLFWLHVLFQVHAQLIMGTYISMPVFSSCFEYFVSIVPIFFGFGIFMYWYNFKFFFYSCVNSVSLMQTYFQSKLHFLFLENYFLYHFWSTFDDCIFCGQETFCCCLLLELWLYYIPNVPTSVIFYEINVNLIGLPSL